MRSKIPIGLILLAIALTAGGYWYFFLQASEEPATMAAGPAGSSGIPVEVAAVRVGTVNRIVEAVGTLRANESIIVRPEVAGRITEIQFSEGQAVKQGAILVVLEDSISKAELAQAQARLGLSQTNYERMNSLQQQGLGSEQERDRTLSELRVSQAELALAQARLDKTTIKAPFDGVLGLRRVSVGDYVSVGQDLVNLLDIDPIKVDFRVPEVYLSEVQTGQPIEVRVDAFPDETFTGEVYALDPQVDINGRSIVVRALIPNEGGHLKPGLFARVELMVERRPNALLIPEDALVPQGDKQFVFRVVDGKATLTEVATGRHQEAEVEITQGLTADDRVVTGGQLKIRDGAPVTPVERTEG